jgi:CDGSH-type Zn-finger protein
MEMKPRITRIDTVIGPDFLIEGKTKTLVRIYNNTAFHSIEFKKIERDVTLDRCYLDDETPFTGLDIRATLKSNKKPIPYPWKQQ